MMCASNPPAFTAACYRIASYATQLKLLSVFTCLSLVGPNAHADSFFGVYVGAGFWQNKYSGTFATGTLASSGDLIDLDSDLNLDNESNNFVYAAIEHPIPLIPNLQLSQTEIENSSDTVLARDITYQATEFSADTAINAEVELTFSDVTFYYQLLDNWVSMDLGFTARNFDGILSIRSSTVTASVDVDEIVPLIYAQAMAELPLSGFYATGKVYGLSLDDDSMTDISVAIGYESSFGVGGEIGYRLFTLDFADIDDLTTDIDIEGLFLATTFHF